LICHLVLAEDIASDDASLLCLSNIADTLPQDGVTIVCAAIPGQEADETLCRSGQLKSAARDTSPIGVG
jgi:hypothetical protein